MKRIFLENFRLKQTVLILLIGSISLWPQNVLACAACFYGSEKDPMNVALRWSILCLLVILLVVLGLFAKFFLSIRKREQKLINTH